LSRRNGLRDRWLRHVVRCRELDGETRAHLLWMGGHMTEAGAFTGHTRDDIADIFDVIPRRVAERFERAQKARLLDRVGGGYKGHPARWNAVIPNHPQCAGFRALSTSKGADLAHPISAPFKRTQRADRVRNSAPHDARVTNVTMKNAPKRERRVLLPELSPWARLA
jgi:hypothetical protein